MDNESKEPIEAFEVYLDLYAQAEKLKKELTQLDYQLMNQRRAVGNALGIHEGEYAFTGVDGTVVVVKISDYEVEEIKVIEKLEVKS